MLGAGLALAGIGIKKFAEGFKIMVDAIIDGLQRIISALPGLVDNIGKTFDAAGRIFSTAIPNLVSSMGQGLKKIVTSVRNTASPFVSAFSTMGSRAVSKVGSFAGSMLSKGTTLGQKLVSGVRSNVGKMGTAGIDSVTRFLNSVASKLPALASAGANLAVTFVQSVANAIRDNQNGMNSAMQDLGYQMARGMITGLASGAGGVISAAKDVALQAYHAAKAAIESHSPSKKFHELGVFASMGLANGILALKRSVGLAGEDIANTAIDSAADTLGVHSPSTKFIALGKYVVEGFSKGIHGNRKQIDAAFNDLKYRLKTTISTTEKDIDSLKVRLAKRSNARMKANLQKQLAQAKKELAAEKAAYKQVTKALSDRRTKLGKLADQYDKVAKKLDAANANLAAKKKQRDDYYAQVKEEYDTLPELSSGTTVAGYNEKLQIQIKKTKELNTVLSKLRKLGLNDDMYKQLVAGGVDSLNYANELLASGKKGVKQANDLNSQMNKAAGSLSTTSSKQLYQAAVDSAQGIVDGLKKQQKNIEKQMDKIADAMVKAIKKKLGIHSPSKVFDKEVGQMSGKGVSNGLVASIKEVVKSSTAVGDAAVAAMAKSLSKINDVVNDNMNLSPTITPVLDTTSIGTGVNKITRMLSGQTLNVGSNSLVASRIGMPYDQKTTQPITTQTPAISLVQNNYSPKALSRLEIYRDTRSQLSTLKGALSR